MTGTPADQSVAPSPGVERLDHPELQHADRFATLEHGRMLQRAATEAKARGLDDEDYLIVDIDFHYSEFSAWHEIMGYMEDPVLREFLEAGGKGSPWLPASVAVGGIQDVSGRIKPQRVRDAEAGSGGAEVLLAQLRETIGLLGLNYIVAFPTELLHFGTNPFADLEAPFARAHARWITERVLSQDRRVLTLLYLPFGDPDAALEFVEEFGDAEGVVGFMVTSVRHRAVHDPAYYKVYAAIEERGLTLGFHAAFHYYERSMEQFNRFISVHALGFPHYQMINVINWVINGMVERFPKLPVVFIEGGLAYLPFVMERLDHEYMMRPSEAPLLNALPSDYMRRLYYSSQPLESARNPAYLQTTFEMINAESQLLYASDYPHWDFDLPSRIYDIPFLSEQAKRNILGGNAARLFNLDAVHSASTPAG